MPAEFDVLTKTDERIIAPGSDPTSQAGGVNAGYFTAYSGGIPTSDVFGCAGVLANDPTRCAALNRHTYLLPSAQWENPANFYQASPANWYASSGTTEASTGWPTASRTTTWPTSRRSSPTATRSTCWGGRLVTPRPRARHGRAGPRAPDPGSRTRGSAVGVEVPQHRQDAAVVGAGLRQVELGEDRGHVLLDAAPVASTGDLCLRSAAGRSSSGSVETRCGPRRGLAIDGGWCMT